MPQPGEAETQETQSCPKHRYVSLVGGVGMQVHMGQSGIWRNGQFDGGDMQDLQRLWKLMTLRMVSKANDLKKYEGKRTCKSNGDPFLNLKKGDTFFKRDCKYL